jgi:hypothetical protein
MAKALRRGSSGPAVLAVQRELKRHWFPELNATGNYDSETEAAVRHFQASVGFTGKDVDGVVGNKTMVALFQTFDIKMRANLIPSLKMPSILSTPPSLLLPVPPGNAPPGPTGAPVVNATKPEIPKKLQLSMQVGVQESRRDGPGIQMQWGLTARTRAFWPKSDKNKVYHDIHFEAMPNLVLQIPIPPLSSIYAGQLGITIQPLTDWLVIRNRWHMLTPSFGAFGQYPLNRKQAAPGKDDPSTHARIGFNAGLELFHVEFNSSGMSLGLAGQISGYHDFTDHRLHLDPGALIFWQGPLGSW